MTQSTADQRDSLDSLVGGIVAGKYRVDRLLGRGGMGAVFQATNVAIGKRVALKFLSRDAARDGDAAQRFQREAVAASLVESAHIVQIFDSGTSEEGLPFLVMELLPGEDLRSRLNREGRLSVETTLNVATQVLRALMRAHEAGIVHRDLKPDNVFLCERDDGALFVKIVDFGISKLSRSSTVDTLTRRGTVLGTAYYMSPEQAQAYADIDGRTDLFSVGAIVYECLAGRPPHVAPTYESVLIAICTKDPADLRSFAPEVTEALWGVIEKALARDRDVRYQSAASLLDAIVAAVPTAFTPPFGGTPSVASQRNRNAPNFDAAAAFASTSRTPSAIRRRSASTWATALVAVLAGFALTALWVQRRAPATNGASARPAASVVAAPREAPIAPSASALAPARAPAAASLAPPVSSAFAEGGGAAALASSGAVQPAASASATLPTRKKTRAAPRREPAKPAARPPSGVANGLELSTREP